MGNKNSISKAEIFSNEEKQKLAELYKKKLNADIFMNNHPIEAKIIAIKLYNIYKLWLKKQTIMYNELWKQKKNN